MERLVEGLLAIGALAAIALLVGLTVLLWSYIDEPSRFQHPRVVITQCQEGVR